MNLELFCDRISIAKYKAKKGVVSINNIFELLTQKLDSKQILCDEPMSKHTSFKIGGKADFYVIAQTIEEIEWVVEVSNANNIPLTIVGNGTNLLVLDNGIRGIVLRPNLTNIEIDETTVTVGAGALLTMVSKKVADYGLKGLEFAYGIPGTIGGALRMNAGAYGGEMKDVVQQTTYMDKRGKVYSITDHEFTYRNSIFSRMDVIILETTIKLEKGDIEEIKEKMKQHMESRKANQPLDMPNAGSTFKRGEDFITAQLIDRAGLKGYSIGDAEVSTKHAGFVVNKGTATASDILELVDHIQEQVYKKFEKNIELEVIVIGED